MMVPFLALSLAGQIVIAVADTVPKLDVTRSCRAAADAANSKDRLQTCIESEQKTRDQLAKDWSTFPAADRANCINAIVSFAPTYTELITCLEMKRDVKNLPSGDAAAKKTR